MTNPHDWQPSNPPVPAVPQRSWFARHKALSIVLGAILLIVLCCAGAGIMAIGGADSSSTGSGVDGTSTDSGAEPKTSAGKDAAPRIGSPVRDGKFEFTVTEVETGVAQVGSEFLEETADGQFVLVHLTVKNIGDESQTLFDSEQKLIDAQGRSFSTDSAASISIPDNDMWINEINPGNSASGTLVYDMPADAEPAEIELHDSMFSGGVTVSLK